MFDKTAEFFQDGEGKLSTPSAMAWIATIGLMVVIIIDAWHSKTDSGVIMAYCGLIAGLYGIKKGVDSSEIKAQIRADKPTPPPPDPVIPSPITMNVGAATPLPKEDISAKDVTVKAKGNVSVTKEDSDQVGHNVD